METGAVPHQETCCGIPVQWLFDPQTGDTGRWAAYESAGDGSIRRHECGDREPRQEERGGR